MPPSLSPHVLTVVRVQVKVLDAIVARVAVDVVNNFNRVEISPKVALHHQSMLSHVPAAGTAGMFWKMD